MKNLTKIQKNRLQKLKDHLFKVEEAKLLKRIEKARRKKPSKVISCRVRLSLFVLLESVCDKKKITINKFLVRLLKKELKGGLK